MICLMVKMFLIIFNMANQIYNIEWNDAMEKYMLLINDITKKLFIDIFFRI